MTDAQQREAARQFFYKWQGKGREDEDGRSYWIDLLQNVLGLENVTDRVEFEKKVVGADGNTKRIDAYIPETKTLIEQKSLGVSLDKPQAGHGGQTPYEQAKYYDNGLPHSEKARWIILSDFAEIWIYDMDQKRPEDNIVKIAISDLQTKYSMLSFLYKENVKQITEEMELSLKAGELVGRIHDRFLEQYHDPMAKKTQNSLNILCVRLVFCLYAEDAGLFEAKDSFKRYIEQYEPKDIRTALISLFEVLNTPEDERAEMYLSDELEAFPYVNGGLFERKNIVIPRITDEIKEVLIESAVFDWSKISPTIFGAVFESTLNPETRRAGGMHYTSIENIHKVIDPLFLDDLKAEFEEIKKISVLRTKKQKLAAFQDKLASLHFLDPAAGSGNFLTETYISLRRIENDVIRELTGGQISFGDFLNPIKVSISQFNGIEINDFAVTVARTALWIAESQMMRETEDIVHMTLDFLPLKTAGNIVEGNALRMDWNSIIDKKDLNYIMGNPPFIGSSIMAHGSPQKEDVHHVFPDLKKNEVQDLDYVTCWYKIAAEYIQGTKIECCFVSTNSICQGSMVPILWNVLLNEYKIHINYAYQTFSWNSESRNQATVHCVIIGFSLIDREEKRLYSENNHMSIAKNISPYLTDGPNVFVVARKKPICNVPGMIFGNQPRDGGFLIIDKDEREEILKAEPGINKWLREYVGAVEFLRREKRWCLWLRHATPSDIKGSKIIYSKVESVRKFRLASRAKTTNGYAKVPHLFAQMTQPEDMDFLLIPRVSSERRRYVPIGFMDKSIIASDAVQIVPNATLYHFGILTSNVHMSWMRAVCGRLETRYRYSKEIVYNNFPWPDPTEEQKQKIEQTANAILDVRTRYPNESFATLYDSLTMPPDLLRVHQLNNTAVMRAYGMPIKETDEAACVAWLMRLYQEKTNGAGPL